MDYNVGDIVYVPNAIEWKWESCMTTIKEIIVSGDSKVYYADCPHNNLFSNDSCIQLKEMSFKEHELFKTRQDCDEYVKNYYYDGLCNGCSYKKKSGNIWKCGDCSYAEKVVPENSIDNYILKCSRTGITVGNQYSGSIEICKFYDPTLDQNIRECESWEKYEDILKNCEFNKKCDHHSTSCHTTCSYERYLNEMIKIPIKFEFYSEKLGKRVVKQVAIHRKQWIEQNFLYGDIVECYFLVFERELTKTRRIKKNVEYIESFNDKLTKVNIKEGKVIG